MGQRGASYLFKGSQEDVGMAGHFHDNCGESGRPMRSGARRQAAQMPHQRFRPGYKGGGSGPESSSSRTLENWDFPPAQLHRLPKWSHGQQSFQGDQGRSRAQSMYTMEVSRRFCNKPFSEPFSLLVISFFEARQPELYPGFQTWHRTRDCFCSDSFPNAPWHGIRLSHSCCPLG